MRKIQYILLKRNMTQFLNSLQDLLIAIKLKPSIFLFGLTSGFILGFIFTNAFPELLAQKYFSTPQIQTTK